MHIPCSSSPVGSGRSTGMLSMVWRVSLKSLRLAPSTTAPTGTPRASVRMLRLTPFLPRSVGLGPVFFPPERGLAHRPVHGQPGPVDAHEVVVLQEARLPELQEDALADPLLEAVVRRRAGAEAGGIEGVPLAAGAQDVEDGAQTLPVRAPGPAAAEAVGVPACGYPALQLLPQLVGDAPLVRRGLLAHRPTSC